MITIEQQGGGFRVVQDDEYYLTPPMGYEKARVLADALELSDGTDADIRDILKWANYEWRRYEKARNFEEWPLVEKINTIGKAVFNRLAGLRPKVTRHTEQWI